jgi:hypothetical protein
MFQVPPDNLIIQLPIRYITDHYKMQNIKVQTIGSFSDVQSNNCGSLIGVPWIMCHQRAKNEHGYGLLLLRRTSLDV